MRKLNRTESPTCLSNYHHGRDEWHCVSGADKVELWQQLEAMQGAFCAYCERRLNDKKHIEHFFRRREKPQKTFEWANLFGSCNDLNSCGNYKDNKAPSTIDMAKVCKPDSMDPADYLVFVADGTVVPKEGLSDSDTKIAQNTILIFNLNGNSKLRGKRRQVALIGRQFAQDYFELLNEYSESGDLEVKELLESERNENLAKFENEEHSAVLRQIWSF